MASRYDIPTRCQLSLDRRKKPSKCSHRVLVNRFRKCYKRRGTGLVLKRFPQLLKTVKRGRTQRQLVKRCLVVSKCLANPRFINKITLLDAKGFSKDFSFSWSFKIVFYFQFDDHSSWQPPNSLTILLRPTDHFFPSRLLKANCSSPKSFHRSESQKSCKTNTLAYLDWKVSTQSRLNDHYFDRKTTKPLDNLNLILVSEPRNLLTKFDWNLIKDSAMTEK